MMAAADALDVAHRIAVRLTRAAHWDDDRCTWDQVVKDQLSPPWASRIKKQQTGPWIYSGTAGIALFLLEAYRLVGDESLLRTGNGALAHARAHMLAGFEFSFHSGPIGVAHAFARRGKILMSANDVAFARSILASSAGREHDDRAFDIIGGAAGSIPALIRLADVIPDGLPIEIEIRLGENLLQSAVRGRDGWSWEGPLASARDLTGYAHGVAGIALALFELYVATGDDRFQYASHQAIAYERHHYDAVQQNWPDFRHMAFSEFMTRRASMSEDERFTVVDALKPFNLGFMSAWCHGASGIMLARLRMLELSNDVTYLDEAALGMRTVVRDLQGDEWTRRSFCLCHGAAGDCEALLLAAGALADLDARETAHHVAERGAEQFELAGVPWRSGAANAAPDPSLMIGDAGVGYFYLRLAAPDVPSILAVTPDVRHPIPHVGEPEAGAHALDREYVSQHFADTIRVLQRVDGDAAWQERPSSSAPLSSAVEQCYDAIVRRIDRETDDLVRAKLRDAFATERLRFEAAANLPWRCDVVIDDLRGRRHPSFSWDGTVVALSRGVRLVEGEWDWRLWLADRSLQLADVPPNAGTITAVWLAGDTIRVDRLSPLSVAVVERLVDAGDSTLDEIVAAIAPSLGETADPSTVSTLTTAVDMQLARMKDAGLVEFRARTPIGPSQASHTEAYA